MYISLKWIQEIIGVQKLTLNGLVNRLTLAGFEIESITSKKGFESSDIIIDISFTANRADVSNLRGLITELNTLFTSNSFLEIPINISPLLLLEPKSSLGIFNLDLNFYLKKIKSKVNSVDFKTLKNRLVKSKNYKIIYNYKGWQHKYYIWEWYLQKKSFNKILKNLSNRNLSHLNEAIMLHNITSKNIEIKPSPYWIKKRLSLMGFNPVNNIIDTVNYLMLETGQVFFAYDLGILENIMTTTNLAFITKYVGDKSLFHISESKTITLKNNILVLTLNNKIISIPGFIQDYNTIVNKNTSSVLLQYGLYDSKSIKKSSKILNLKTDYSIKSEKQTDLNLLEQSYLRLMHLFWAQDIKFESEKINKSKIEYLKNHFSLFYRYIKQSDKRIKISYQNIKKLTGPYNSFNNLSDFQIIRNLKLLNFKIYLQTDKNCFVLVPLARKIDLEREVDIIEEIVRVIGFNKFKPLAITNNQFGYLTKIEKLKRRLREYFLNLGFNESIHSILMKKEYKNEISLKNPLFNESSVLRLSLLKGIIEKVKFNQKNIGENFEAFESGRVYNLLGSGHKKEIEVISGVFGGKIFHSAWGNKNSSINWFEAKGVIETLMEKLNLPLSISWSPANNCGINFHPNLTTNFFIENQKLGVFGQIHPTLALKNNIQKKIYLFEINTGILNRFSESKNLIHYSNYSSYPISYIDLSFIINKSIFSYDIKEIISQLAQPLLKSLRLFDYYSKKPIKEGYCSLSFKLKFQSEIRTLSNEEVLEITRPIIFYLEKHYDIKFQE
uniref:phenylalanine--tRNA ligase n=1 Tax=Ectocarpus siliculosus TaxID=2880 RepID=D1J710_ECTSI|nr:phenylalanyl tRNA synthetase beta subunit [Ectocarpus siliculosus]CAT18704.1 phenylalanyl tRNA synthetase beta subunit [Ectocarpus siliculosus]CAV31194.1 phenylalanyl tRNA synthetase beta subunit [Ectocarpus siliculosus]